MTRRAGIFLGGLLVIAVLAFAMQRTVERMLIRPALYVWWIAGLYYDALPQILWWILIVAASLWFIMGSLTPEQKLRPRKADPPFMGRGQVESLALWLNKASRGNYFKWLVAQRLAQLARDLLTFRARRNPPSARTALRDADWNPPAEVASYLDAGLNRSFADFPQARWPFESPRPTPLDLNPHDALEIIESNLEKS